MNKRGFQLSFGIIFSIFLIIIIIVVAFYVIGLFLGLGKCSEISLFYKDFQDEVNGAWSSEITQDTFKGFLPGGIKYVCFGNLTQSLTDQQYQEQYEDLRKYRRQNANLFLYPIEKSCAGSGYVMIDHVDFSELNGFTCFPSVNNRVDIVLEKGSFDTLVKIKKE